MINPSLGKAALSLLGSAVLIAGAASAADSPAAAAAPVDKAAREKMAAMHDQMAACLRSEKAVASCHEEMQRKCSEAFGAGGCPMEMEGHHMARPHHGAPHKK